MWTRMGWLSVCVHEPQWFVSLPDMILSIKAALCGCKTISVHLTLVTSHWKPPDGSR